ncbi:metal-sensitive transcriptional regulator [Planococcus sp. N028]|uniref:Metal-sensitive transcriptional regulator n=1 Tax=Planococcus shixiaomingii TaxID=3058393 RepID=A0ABT8N314_9BACL|nr:MULTISPECIES: metal-sensitive transcriptional regulator [unclassified Planococcus (in: firmicutes)]MDN7242283.1 metal-sensitive transcriptional regulator [Planococcus sp. N028]WKA54537.1 metal-sensitive transcriptional regulator [Planococcus sp. N022]
MKYDKQVQNRLKRIEGQLKGVLRMMEENEDCRDVVMQLSAIRTATDRAIGVIVSENLEACVRESLENGGSTEDVVKEAVELLVKSR